MPTTTTHAITTVVRLSCNHTLARAKGDDFPMSPERCAPGATLDCPKCPARKTGGQPSRRIKAIETTNVETPVVEAPAETPEPFAPEGYDLMVARDEWKALKAWNEAGQVGDRPSTANLDAMNGAHAAGKPRTGRKAATRKATTPKRTKAAGLRFHVGDRAMPDSQNKLSSVAWQATKGLGDDGGRVNTTALVALLAAAGISDPENTAWSHTLANDVTISATV